VGGSSGGRGARRRGRGRGARCERRRAAAADSVKPELHQDPADGFVDAAVPAGADGCAAVGGCCWVEGVRRVCAEGGFVGWDWGLGFLLGEEVRCILRASGLQWLGVQCPLHPLM